MTAHLQLETRSQPCRSRKMRSAGRLTVFVPGEGSFIFRKSNYHRYGTKWAQWREIGQNDSLRELEWLEASLAAGVEDGAEETLDLGFDARLQITSVTGTSLNSTGDTCLLKAKLSNGVNWGPHGDKTPSDELSKRPSPYFPPLVLSHLSGDETSGARILRFHWTLNEAYVSDPSISNSRYLRTISKKSIYKR